MWLARDKNGDLVLYEYEPGAIGDDPFFTEWPDDRIIVKLPKDLYPEITFENSPVELVLKFE